MDSKINKFYSEHEDKYLEKIIENFSSQPSPKIKLEEIIKIVKENYHNKYIKINWTSITHLRKWDFINAAIKKLNKKNIEYLEIGVFRNENFDLINCESKISVDPDPESKATFKTTSDEFFSKNKKKFDVIFIDGLHEYLQCQKDTINALNCLNENGYIFFHDFVPRNFLEEYNPRIVNLWTGDVWKVSIELSQSSGLDFSVILADCGLGMLIKKSNNFNYKYLNDSLKDLGFKEFLNLNKTVCYKDADEAYKNF